MPLARIPGMHKISDVTLKSGVFSSGDALVVAELFIEE